MTIILNVFRSDILNILVENVGKIAVEFQRFRGTRPPLFP